MRGRDSLVNLLLLILPVALQFAYNESRDKVCCESRGLVGDNWVKMEEVSAETKTQKDETAEPPHPVSSDLTEFPEYNQEEHKETLEDKTTGPEDTIDSNQSDHTNDKTNGIDPALLQSEEPKSKVSTAYLYAFHVCKQLAGTSWQETLGKFRHKGFVV